MSESQIWVEKDYIASIESELASLRSQLAERDTRIAELERECERLKVRYQMIADERAHSFAMLDELVGGTGLTEYQPEMDLAIAHKVKALKSDLAAAMTVLGEIAEADTSYFGVSTANAMRVKARAFVDGKGK